MKTTIPIFIFLVILPSAARKVFSQCSGTPTFNVDLSSNPNASWTSPSLTRAGSCCLDNNCVAFNITLHPNATEVSLNISSGAIPTGSLFYQLGCGGMQTIGGNICVTGVGPHLLTFCKPGNNINTYTITSNPVQFSPDLTMTEGTSASLYATGLTPSTIVWTSIYPGVIGAYNAYLSCTNCANPNISAPLGAPPLVRYLVSGNVVSGCLPITRLDTVNVTILSNPLGVNLENFSANYHHLTNQTELNWSTNSEIGNDYFRLERGKDMASMIPITTIPGNENSQQFIQYSYHDDNPPTNVYYQLVQVDISGHETISGTAFVPEQHSYNSISYNIYPNPNDGIFSIEFSSFIEGFLQISDCLGRVHLRGPISGFKKQINFPELQNGLYTIIIQTNEGEDLTSRILINR